MKDDRYKVRRAALSVVLE